MPGFEDARAGRPENVQVLRAIHHPFAILPTGRQEDFRRMPYRTRACVRAHRPRAKRPKGAGLIRLATVTLIRPRYEWLQQ